MSDHLAVLVHGLWGNPEHMWYVKKALSDRHPKIQILVSDTNTGNRTYDGVDVCGERISKEVHQKVAALAQEGIEINKISFVGYSLGGLGARYAIGVLHSTGFFDKVKPVSFTTFATPHLGVSPTSPGFFSWIMSTLGPKTLSITGAHIFLADVMKQQRPLLEVMSDPETHFYKGLALFERRAAYANIVNDRSVPFCTAGIVDEDPFQDLTKIHLNHDDEYGGVILDPEKPWSKAEEKVVTEKYPLSVQEIVFRTVMLAGFPLWLTLYSANAVFANYKSSQRITLHREEYPSENKSLISELTQNTVEEALESERSPTSLPLNKHQSKIVSNLNRLEWSKYLVHIRKTQHSHAAIVCRSRDSERLSEGQLVMKHWLDHVFKL